MISRETSVRLFLTVTIVILLIESAQAGPLLPKALEEKFFMACSSGDQETVAHEIAKNKDIDMANARTKDGETCLHLAAIPGSAAVTKLLLEAGADPNIRSTFPQGLRMHPLSWNVYAGHYENVALLLEAGADVNADFDLSMESGEKVTALDIARRIRAGYESSSDDNEEPDRFELTYRLLVAKGGKKYADSTEDT